MTYNLEGLDEKTLILVKGDSHYSYSQLGRTLES
jgi:hypothetical protein